MSETRIESGPEDEISLGDLVGTLRRRRWTVALTTGACLALAAAITLVMPPTFTAEARMLVEQPGSTSSMIGRLANLPVDLSGLMGGAPQTAAEMEVIRSRPVIAAVVGPKGTSALAPEEGLGRTALVDDLERQSLWAGLRRSFQKREPVAGGLAVEVEQWDFAPPYDPLLVTFETPDRVRVSLDRWFGKQERTLTVGPDGALDYLGATLVLEPRGDLTGRTFRLTVQDLQVAVEQFREELSVEETDRGSNVIRVAFPDRDSERAATTVNSIVRSFLAHNRARFLNRADRSIGFVEKELDRVRSELLQVEEEMIAFGEGASAIVIPEAVAAMMEKLVEVDLERARSELRSQAASNLLESIDSGAMDLEGMMGLELYSPAVSSALELEPLAGMLARKQALEQFYTKDWPELRELEVRIQGRVDAIRSTLRTEVTREARLADDLRSILATYEAEMEGLPETQVNLLRFERKLRTYSEIYAFLVAQLEETRFAHTASVPNVEIIDWAVPPVEPDSPRVLVNLALGTILGVFFGTGLAFVREATKRPVVSASGLERVARVPCLLELGRCGRELTAAADSRAEAFRSLRVNLAHRADSAGARSLAVLAERDAGPVAYGLARALAQAGERVLLVDGNLVAPSIASALGVQAPSGLAEVLENKVSAADAVVETETARLFLLAAGKPGPDPMDHVGSRRLTEVLRELAATYDRILVAAPPLERSLDAYSLAAACDSSLWVVESGRIGEERLTECCRRLHLAGASALGAVLTGRTA